MRIINDAPLMRGQRSRNQNGQLRTKRGDTHLSTLEDTYGEISDRRGDTHLATLRELRGLSLSKMVKLDAEITHAPGLNGRIRNQDGRIRAKRGDTQLETLRDTYGLDFAAGLPGNFPLGILRAATGMSLSQMLRHPDAVSAVVTDLA
jgi:hypothetical protein